MSVGTRTKVFLSHAADDDRLAGTVRDRLARLGLDVEAVPGAGLNADASDFTSEFRQALSAADFFAFLVTPRSVSSDDTGIVVGAARMAGKPISILLEGVDAANLPVELQRFPAYPAADPSRFAETL